MCGICGIKGKVRGNALQDMTRALIHRGPDSEGYFRDDRCALGMRRLSILDIEGSEQPLFNENKTVILVCNGEIYNYRKLRKELSEKGHRFSTHGDVEVIVHLYEEFGEDCVTKLDGMFAFAIWDTQRKKLFIARDRLGVKPLYYCRTPYNFLFASEIRSILASGYMEFHLDELSILRYMSYPAVPAPLTIFRQIKAVLPGHSAVIDNSGVRFREYWDVDFVKASQELIPETDAVDAVREVLSKAVEKRLMSDVPLGAFLSGGIDSSAVVALMSNLSSTRVRTFNIRFEGAEKRFRWFDDASYARDLAEFLNTEHTEEVITGKEVLDNLLDSIWAMDQPSGDALQYYLVSKSAKKAVTVALSGTGGDEVFAGYEWFREIRDMEKLHERIRWITEFTGDFFLNILKYMPREYRTGRIRHKLETILMGKDRFIDRYRLNRRMYRGEDWFYLFTPDVIAEVIDSPMDDEPRFELYSDRTEGLDPIARTSYLQLKTDMVNLLLRDQDAVSMAHSLEVRLPLIDYQVVETVARIPSDLKIRDGKEKYILREALSHLLPGNILHRSKKGFIFPMEIWMRRELRDVVESCLSYESVKKRGIFRPETISTLRDDFFNGKEPFFKVWNQVVFELWCRIVLDRKNGWQRPSGTIKDYI